MDYRERQLQVEALKEDLDGALEDLKSARTIGTDAQIAAAEARVTQARADLLRAARVTSSAPVASQSSIPANILDIVSKYQ